jgi:hypothetical protein
VDFLWGFGGASVAFGAFQIALQRIWIDWRDPGTDFGATGIWWVFDGYSVGIRGVFGRYWVGNWWVFDGYLVGI